ncbi:hypothetical protein FORC37_4138 [Vibrio vulnificus]|nr:hypothetical protein FORC37_4138 [Vibrio vulnificus]
MGEKGRGLSAKQMRGSDGILSKRDTGCFCLLVRVRLGLGILYLSREEMKLLSYF